MSPLFVHRMMISSNLFSTGKYLPNYLASQSAGHSQKLSSRETSRLSGHPGRVLGACFLVLALVQEGN